MDHPGFPPVLWNGFVAWDDARMFLENPHHRGFVGDEDARRVDVPPAGEYMPVTWTSYALDRALWDLMPRAII